MKKILWILLLVLLIVLGIYFIWSWRNRPIDVTGMMPGVAVESNTKLLIALPIKNFGEEEADDVTIDKVTVTSGTREFPASLPIALGNIPEDQRKVAQVRFDIAGLNPANTYELVAEGHYRPSRDKDDRKSWSYKTNVAIPPLGPGSDPVKTNTGPTHVTAGPYPALPEPPKANENEDVAPTPEGTPRAVFPKTPTGSAVQKPGGGGAAVGFVIDSQSNGVGSQNFPPDPSAAGSGTGAGGVVIATGNLYVKYSKDGGSTFTTITNLSTVFGDTPGGGYCCDQVVHYIPSIDRFIWLIQTNQKTDAKGNVTAANGNRVAWAKPADIAANFNTAWTWMDVTSTFLGLGNDALDYPDLAVSDGFLYMSTDDTAKGGLVVARISFADLQKPGGSNVSWSFTDPTKSTAAVASHLTQNAHGTMYWAGHNTTSQLRVFSWPDSSGSYSWTDVNSTSYNNTNYTSEVKDGTYWLDPRPKGDAIIGAAFKQSLGAFGGPPPPDQLWFAWTAGRDSNFAQPYVRMVFIDDQQFKNVGEFETWNSDYVFAYPAFAVNSATSEVAVSMLSGGNDKYFMNNVVGFPQDFLLYFTTNSDVGFSVNPAGATGCDDVSGGTVKGRCTRSGDYLSTRRVGSASGLFGTLGYEINLVDSTKSTDCLKAPGCLQNVRWVVFGRPGDINPQPPPPIK